MRRRKIKMNDYQYQVIKNYAHMPYYREFIQQSWEIRHSKLGREMYGAWRWLGLYQMRWWIYENIICKCDKILDFGGAQGPFGYSSVIVDIAKTDIYNNPVKYSAISEFPSASVDVIFSSHALEHVDDIDRLIQCMGTVLKHGGYFIANVPDTRNAKHWHPDNRPEHKRIFSKHEEYLPMIKDERLGYEEQQRHPDIKVVRLDFILTEAFDILFNEYVGDCSIFVIARKK